MILIVDTTTEQASELDVSLQLDFPLNKRANSAYAPSSIYVATLLMGTVLPFVCPNRTSEIQ